MFVGGDIADVVNDPPPPVLSPPRKRPREIEAALKLRKHSETMSEIATVCGTAAGAYFGYKGTDSIVWAACLAIAGGAFPFITIPLAVTQLMKDPPTDVELPLLGARRRR